MHDEEVLGLIRNHVQREKLLFSVCTRALICGAAGVLAGRQVTTHWSTRNLMRYYGAVLVDARVVVDGNLISAAGVTAGLDGALVLVSLLRGDAAAQEIQLAIEYAPDPSFIAELPRARLQMCSKAFERSTSRSELQGRLKHATMRRSTMRPGESSRNGHAKPQ